MAETTILVVDDEPGVLLTCQRWLERAQYKVMPVSSPSQALAILERQPVSLVLVDIRMPGMDGFQLMTLARRYQPDLAVVIMTGFGTVEMAIEALQRGADGLVLKPFEGTDLIRSVQSAIIENQRRHDATRMRVLRPIFDITDRLFSQQDPDRLQALVSEVVATSLQCSDVIIFESTASGDFYRLLEKRGDLPLPHDLHLGTWLSEAASRHPVSWSKSGTASRPLGTSELDPRLEALFTDLGVASAAVTTVAHASELKENLVFLACRQAAADPFGAADLELFAILARQAALALDNARLNAELLDTIYKLEQSRQALTQAEKMAAAGRLTASIAHEINNPLQALSSCLHLAGRDELSIAERKRYLALAQTELDRLMVTVQHMLDLYRPGARDRRLIDINAVIQRVLSLVNEQLSKQNIQVQTRLAKRLPPVMAVGDQIQQVLLNLLINAMEAMPGGGEIILTSRRHDGHVEVLVQDSGPGIPENLRAYLFEPFNSSKPDGTGLGLAVSYGILNAHGGSLTLDTTVERGACFRIRIPIGEVEHESNHSPGR
jgi:signal transduction histidine kinase